MSQAIFFQIGKNLRAHSAEKLTRKESVWHELILFPYFDALKSVDCPQDRLIVHLEFYFGSGPCRRRRLGENYDSSPFLIGLGTRCRVTWVQFCVEIDTGKSFGRNLKIEVEILEKAKDRPLLRLAKNKAVKCRVYFTYKWFGKDDKLRYSLIIIK